MNSVSTAIKLAAICRSQKRANASVSVITVMLDAIRRKPSSRNRSSIWPRICPLFGRWKDCQIAVVRLDGKDRDRFGNAAQGAGAERRQSERIADLRCHGRIDEDLPVRRGGTDP